MYRLVPIAVGLGLMLSCAPVLGADYPDELRDSFDEWDEPQGSPLGFEAGVRYWYSMGADAYGATYSSTDQTQLLEGHLRIEDYTTGSYVRGLAGYSVVINGEFDTPFGIGPIVDGQIGYAGADIGINPFGPSGGASGIYVLGGYQYWNESPNMGREDFAIIESPSDVSWDFGNAFPTVAGDSEPNNIDIHALRLGVSGKVEFNDFIDLTAEVAAVPYAWVNGNFGAFGTPAVYDPGVSASVPVGVATINGHAYGAMGEAMLGFHPTENVTFRVGGRAWYLAGNMDLHYGRAEISAPRDTNADGTADIPYGVAVQEYISTSNPFALFRYGALAELTFKF